MTPILLYTLELLGMGAVVWAVNAHPTTPRLQRCQFVLHCVVSIAGITALAWWMAANQGWVKL